jgi:formamidopyrimidine-DNA glycosylase
MPELPEIETIRRTLSQHVLNLRIDEVLLRWEGAVSGSKDSPFEKIVQGLRILSIERRGKYLLITLEDGWSLIAHMRMTGRLNYYPTSREPEKHTHVVFKLSTGELHFTDTRKFGRFQLVRTGERLELPSLKRLGPEPLEDEFTPQELGRRLSQRKVALKTALLDQTVVAGIGNIYADESLFQAGLSPLRLANSLSEDELERLYNVIRSVLQAGIDAQGTSFRDYRDANGEKGAFQEALKVYGRAGEACIQCGRLLDKTRLGGRTTVFCPNCQH